MFLATIVDEPFADEAVVAELGMLVNDAPEPLNDVAVITPALNAPEASLETMVDAPLEDDADVLALSKLPEEMFDAFSEVNAEPSPEKDDPVIAPALKAPAESLETIFKAPFADAAEVLLFVIVEPIQ